MDATAEHQDFLDRRLARIAPAGFEARGQVVREPGLVWDDDVAPDLAVLLRVPLLPRWEGVPLAEMFDSSRG